MRCLVGALFLWGGAFSQLLFLGCVISPFGPLLAFNSGGLMTPEICNSLAVGFENFYVSPNKCYGAAATLPTILSGTSGGTCSFPCGTDLLCGTKLSFAFYSTVLVADEHGDITTGFYGSQRSPDSKEYAFSHNTSLGQDRISGIGLMSTSTIDFLEVNYTRRMTVTTIAGGNPADKGGRNFSISATDSITDCQLQLLTQPIFGNDTAISGFDIALNDKYSVGWAGLLSGGFSVRPRASVLHGARFTLVDITIRANAISVEQLRFSWRPRGLSQAEGCGSETTAEFASLFPTDKASTPTESLTCSHQLTQILVVRQETSSYVLLFLLAAVLVFDVLVVITSKCWWVDKRAEYITLLTSSLGAVEFVGQALMCKSLAANPEFELEFFLCLGALVASSLINIFGNIYILRRADFAIWFDGSPEHRYVYAFCAAFCFVKGNVVSLLASRLAFAKTQVFTLPWTRKLQLRFRILSLFELAFGSLPQLAMIVMLHNKLEEWTYLNILFLGIGICGVAIVAWRASFELMCPSYGLDRDRNMSQSDLKPTSSSLQFEQRVN